MITDRRPVVASINGRTQAQQSQIIAYVDDYKLLMIATLAVIPLLLVFKKTSDRGSAGPIPIGE
jgi:hypothetical protein